MHHAGPRARAADALWQAHDRSAALRLALLPAELLFRSGAWLRRLGYRTGLRTAVRVNVPVISIGNLTVGGTGKTPFARWLVERLLARGRQPAILHGGYGDDEPELFRFWFPQVQVIAGRDRFAGASAAAAAGADVAILDDGFQHLRLGRDLDVVLVAAEQWTDRPRLLPRGPWREPPSALRRADVVVVTRRTADAASRDRVLECVERLTRATLCAARLTAGSWLGADDSLRRAAGAHYGVARRETGTPGGAGRAPEGGCVLVTGVAAWAPVAAHARTAGAQIEEVLVFADHHAFDHADAERIRRFAGSRPVVCTAKDWVKLRRLLAGAAVHVLDLSLVLERGGSALDTALETALNR